MVTMARAREAAGAQARAFVIANELCKRICNPFFPEARKGHDSHTNELERGTFTEASLRASVPTVNRAYWEKHVI